MDGMGTVDFPITTTSKDTQAFFNQGVAQLYGFWFIEAERSFREAASPRLGSGSKVDDGAVDAIARTRRQSNTAAVPDRTFRACGLH